MQNILHMGVVEAGLAAPRVGTRSTGGQHSPCLPEPSVLSEMYLQSIIIIIAVLFVFKFILFSLVHAARVCGSLPVSLVGGYERVGLLVREEVVEGDDPRRSGQHGDPVVRKLHCDVGKHAIQVSWLVYRLRGNVNCTPSDGEHE